LCHADGIFAVLDEVFKICCTIEIILALGKFSTSVHTQLHIKILADVLK
jgi:hypothetical protein